MVLRRFNEGHCFLGVHAGQPGLIGSDVRFQLCLVLKERARLHIVAVRDTQVLVKTVIQRIELGLPAIVAQVPFPYHRCPVTGDLQCFGDGDFFVGNPCGYGLLMQVNRSQRSKNIGNFPFEPAQKR